jgi:hypothetical protein
MVLVAPIGVASFEDDLGAGVPADEFVRAGADGGAAEAAFVEVAADFIEDVLRDDGEIVGAEAFEGLEVTLGGGEADGVGIEHFARFDVVEVDAKGGGVDLGVADAVEAEFDVVGGEGLAVLPVHAVAEMERVDKLVGGDFVRLGEEGLELERVVIDEEEALDDVRIPDGVADLVLAGDRIESFGIGFDFLDDPVTDDRLLGGVERGPRVGKGTARSRTGARSEAKGAEKKKEAAARKRERHSGAKMREKRGGVDVWMIPFSNAYEIKY